MSHKEAQKTEMGSKKFLWFWCLFVALFAGLPAVVGCNWQENGQAAGQGGPIVKLGPNGDLQRAIDRARPGDTIILEAGKVYKAPITLPVKSGAEFISIQSSRVSELPENTRVTPAQSDLLARLQSSEKSAPIVKTQPGAHHFKFIGIEFSTTDAQVVVHDLIRLGDAATTNLDDVPHHLIIDRSYIHGFPTQEVQRGVSLNSAETSITNSYISDIHGKGYDTQAICGWNGPGPFKIVNNYLEAAGENIMFGGSDPKIKDLVPADIEIRDNYFFKPLSWKVGDPSYAGQHWSVKNLFELKSARRVTIDRNIFENNWVDAQAGPAILFTVRNQDGTAPWSTIEDVTFTNNIVKNSPAALNLLGRDNLQTSQRARGLKITNNLFTNISGTFLTMSGYPDVTIASNTHVQSGNIMTLHGDPSPNFVYEKNVTIRDSKGYGVKGDATGEGTIALSTFAPSATFRDNVIVGANASQYPAKNYYPASLTEVGFIDPSKGDFRLDPASRYHRSAQAGGLLGVNPAALPKPPSK
jgi:hypothetical protein